MQLVSEKSFETSPEIERIRRTYQHYQEANFAQKLWSANNPGNRKIVAERTLALQTLLKQAHLLPLAPFHILDIGCGNGDVLAEFLKWGAQPNHLFGIELLESRILSAKQRYPSFHWMQGNAEYLPYKDSSFDLVVFFTVFSSILDARMRINVAQEVNRVLKPGGAVIWYDFRYRNPKNPNTLPMGRKQLLHLFPGYRTQLIPITLLPPLARKLGRLTDMLYPLLANLTLLRTHYIGLMTKPNDGEL
ncbi:MAG: class I SAM-dependent methyltransferase [Caldilinea sp.]|uniref:class I SAM-dependent methyltransferase n=1 Tax=Caldilinea sp. TaxID=2293560 RepID=UPI00309B14FC